MIKITFPDGNVKEFAKGTTAYQIAESISPRLAADSLAASVNGATVDLNRAIEEDASIKFYKWDDPEGKHAFWHTSSHLLAEALEALYPGIKFGIGPAIENGFYYDVDSPVPITEADLETIEKKMIELSRNKEQLIRTEVSKADALKNFTEKGDPYKVELIRDLEDGTISFYTNGAFTDLCRGPHLPNTGLIKAIKLTSVAGAYWRGNEKNKMLTRIYGISFPKKSMLDEYLAMMEEAKKRDHRKLGKEMESYITTGRLAPDQVVIDMIADYIAAHKHAKGNIFDGFPRTTHQAEEFDRMLSEQGLKVDVMIYMDVPEEELVKRILLRGKESGRADDASEEVIRDRIKVYHEQTAIVADFYAKQGKFADINGLGTMDEVFDRICQVIDSIRK